MLSSNAGVAAIAGANVAENGLLSRVVHRCD
jgi:hypothetical protein